MNKILFSSLLLGVSLFQVVLAQSPQGTNAAVNADFAVFADPLATSLKKDVKLVNLNKIKDPQIKATAIQLLNKKYTTAYRLATYKPILSPKVLGQSLAIGDGYSKYENVTGIYLPVGKHIVLVANIPAETTVNLLVPNFERRAPEGLAEPSKDPNGWGLKKQSFALKNGINVLDVKDFGGLAYVDYFVDELKGQSPIKVHFLDAAVNGYFDNTKHTDADWDRLLENNVYPVLDALGEHIQVAYPKEALKKYAAGRGKELINNYDSLVYRQHRLMGLIKYNKEPKNRILARVNYNYYMFRDGDGVAYMGVKPGYAMNLVADPDRVIKGDPCWGFSHEIGHVHQLRPNFNWRGLGEVSNNLFSLYVTRSFGNKSRVLEQDNYGKSRADIIDKGISYLQDPDVFNRLIPFWQLQLYFEGAGKNPDFYPDLFEELRIEATTKPLYIIYEENGKRYRKQEPNPAVYQLDFVKKACAVSKTDLTDFFDKYGFFYVGEFQVDDYGKATYSMTQAMVDDCKQAIKAMQLAAPKVDISLLKD